MKKDLIAIYSAEGVSAGHSPDGNLLHHLQSGKPQLSELIEEQGVVYKAAQVNESLNSEMQEWASHSKLRLRADRVAQLGAFATHKTIRNFHDSLQHIPNISLLVGSSRGPTSSLESAMKNFLSNGRVSALTSPTTTLGALVSCISGENIVPMKSFGLSATCTSGLAAIIQGAALLNSGQVDVCIAVGTEAPLTPFTHAALRAANVLTSNWNQPFPCMPLSTNYPENSGMMLGEGAASFLLAKNDQPHFSTQPLAIISGFATAIETTPSPTGITLEGQGLQQSMKEAMNMSGGIIPDVILCHAPGTITGDTAEVNAIEKTFHQETLPAIYSPKWLLGHTLGASGSLSLLLGLELLRSEELPILPYDSPHNKRIMAKSGRIRNIMINSSGFGGFNTSIMISKY
ncbi:hypothetical protein EBR25_03035 [bacterium]|nr:hypothetical protein [bacterium]